MTKPRLRVGIVGLQPGRSWGAVAHLPALRSLADDYEIVGVANSHLASAEQAAANCGLPHAFASVADLVASDAVDIVAVTVKVPHHFEITKAAIDAGKHVYCEWPLGGDLAEAETLADLARRRGVLGVVGTQARCAPEIEHLRRLIADGYVGEVLSTSVIGTGAAWGPQVTRQSAYTADVKNGATLLTIPVGHALAALQDVLGQVREVSARLVNRRSSATVLETGETIAMTAPDQVLISGELEGGAALSLHYRGGGFRGDGLLWEINGSEGDIRVTGATGHIQMVQLTLAGGKGGDRVLRPISVAGSLDAIGAENATSRNVARAYARMAADLRGGVAIAPSFGDAVALHRLIAAVEESANRGEARPVAR